MWFQNRRQRDRNIMRTNEAANAQQSLIPIDEEMRLDAPLRGTGAGTVVSSVASTSPSRSVSPMSATSAAGTIATAHDRRSPPQSPGGDTSATNKTIDDSSTSGGSASSSCLAAIAHPPPPPLMPPPAAPTAMAMAASSSTGAGRFEMPTAYTPAASGTASVLDAATAAALPKVAEYLQHIEKHQRSYTFHSTNLPGRIGGLHTGPPPAPLPNGPSPDWASILTPSTPASERYRWMPRKRSNSLPGSP